MKAFLIITLVLMQDDGSMTRQHDVQPFKTVKECRSAMESTADVFKRSGMNIVVAELQCIEPAVLEVIQPPKRDKPKVKA